MIDLACLTLTDLNQKAAAKFRNRLAFAVYREGHTYNRITYREWGIRARQFGGLLRTLGLHPGDRVMILAENRPEWPVAYFGVALGGLVSVPVLPDCSPEQIKAIGDHAGIAALCITEKTYPKIAPAGIDPAIPLIYLDKNTEIDHKQGRAVTDILVSVHCRKKTVPLWQGDRFGEPENWFPEIREEDLASIWYSSGTTGHGKGVMLSHRNLLFTAQASCALMKIFPRDRILSMIPLAHTYECILGLLTTVLSGASVTYLDRPPTQAVLLSAIQALRPTIMVTPLFFIENIYRHRIAPALMANPLYTFPLTRFLAVKIAGHTLMAALGSSIRFLGIGGASLSPELERFLRKVQFPYAPGYGLTETSILVAGTGPYRFPLGSAGKPIKGVELRLCPLSSEKVPGTPSGYTQGEIQVRGPNVMLGYYRDPEATKEAFTPDAWLKTGDVGFLDQKGYLFIRGRIKATILGSSGEQGLFSASNPTEDVLVYPGEQVGH
ncbi:MAG: AMP-binding protein [Treponema sp.]|jgi:long-chain acyl-CoA synthetase|nr:AMP-binding protein [Treponema sp.]